MTGDQRVELLVHGMLKSTTETDFTYSVGELLSALLRLNLRVINSLHEPPFHGEGKRMLMAQVRAGIHLLLLSTLDADKDSKS